MLSSSGAERGRKLLPSCARNSTYTLIGVGKAQKKKNVPSSSAETMREGGCVSSPLSLGREYAYPFLLEG